MKYLVTGGAGFIGSRLALLLLELDHNVVIVDDLSTGYKSNIPTAAEFVQGDCSSDETIERLNTEKFDAIFHLAGQSSGEISFEDPIRDLSCNTTSTLRLLDYARKTSCIRFVYASSMSVYGQSEVKVDCAENDPAAPTSFYAVGKLASEHYCRVYSREYGINTTSLRLFNVYGPGQNMENLKQGMVSIYLKQFLDPSIPEVVVKGSLSRFRDLVYIDDVVDAIWSLSNNPETTNRIVNVGTGLKTTVSEMISMIQKTVNSKKQVRVESGTSGDQFGVIANTEVFRTLYKGAMCEPSDGIPRMIDFVIRHA